jgi:hypothetical protein
MRTVITTTVAGGLAVMLFAGQVRADRTFADTEFATAGWGQESRTTGAGGTAAFSQVATGNPGNARRVTINVGAGPSLVQAMSRFGTSQATRYDPAVEGALVSVSFALDYRRVSGPSATVIPAAKQGSFVYIALGFAATAGDSWQTLSIPTLVAGDFVRWDGAGTLDFSASAEPIRFGFVSGVGQSDGAPAQAVTDFDNFEVVARVPTPGAALAMAMMGVVGLARRRRTSPTRERGVGAGVGA